MTECTAATEWYVADGHVRKCGSHVDETLNPRLLYTVAPSADATLENDMTSCSTLLHLDVVSFEDGPSTGAAIVLSTLSCASISVCVMKVPMPLLRKCDATTIVDSQKCAGGRVNTRRPPATMSFELASPVVLLMSLVVVLLPVVRVLLMLSRTTRSTRGKARSCLKSLCADGQSAACTARSPRPSNAPATGEEEEEREEDDDEGVAVETMMCG